LNLKINGQFFSDYLGQPQCFSYCLDQHGLGTLQNAKKQ
jgi:hypothetical protein